jgi:hypothetical protein
MSCPNCDHEDVEWSDEYGGYWWVLSMVAQYDSRVINYRPFCGEQLLSPSEACVRWCDG